MGASDLTRLPGPDLIDHYRESFQWCVIEAEGKAPRGRWKGFQSRQPTKAEHRKVRRHVELGGEAFLVCGEVSGNVAVLDLDTKAAIRHWKGHLGDDWDRVPKARTPSGGFHLFFRSEKPVPKTKGEGWDLQAEGGGVVLPSGNGKRSWVTPPNGSLPDFDLIAQAVASRPADDPRPGEPIPEGERDGHLTSLAGTMRKRGMGEAAILAALTTENNERCEPRLPEAQVLKIARSAGKWSTGEEKDVADELHRLRVRDEARRRHQLERTEAQTGDTHLYTLSEAEAEAEREIDWVVPDLLAAGEKGVIAGPPKSLKTWFALHFAHAIATGGRALAEPGWEVPEGQPVLFVQEEGNSQRWARRAVTVFEDAPDAPFLYRHRAGFSLLTEGHVSLLIQQANENGARAVILDPLQRITPGVNENDATEVGPAWDAIHRIASETDAAVVVLHHSRKGGGEPTMDSIRGSSRVAGEVDLMFVLRRVERGTLELYLDGRDLPPRAHSEDGNFEVAYDADQPHKMELKGVRAVGKNRTRGAVTEVLRAAGQALSTGEIHKGVKESLGSERDRTSIRRNLDYLVGKGRVRKDLGGQGRATKWEWVGE